MPKLSDRNRRRPLSLTVVARGQDSAGHTFHETTRCLNVSGGGLLLETTRPFACGDRLELEIELPPPLRRHFGGRERYRVQAMVCRVESRPESSDWRVGLRFLGELRS